MIYFLPLTNKKSYGRMPIYDEQMNPKFMLLGNLGPQANTIFLNDLSNQEVGRLSKLDQQLGHAYLLSVPNNLPMTVRLLGNATHPLIYITQCNYFVSGSSNKGSYVFRHGLKKIATIKLIVTAKGQTFKVNIFTQNNHEAILLITALLTYRDLSGIKIKQPRKVTAYQPSF